MQVLADPSSRFSAIFATFLRGLWFSAIGVLLVGVLRAQDASKTNFDLPSDYAAKTFRLFSGQSGRGLIADAEVVKNIRTRPVKGTYTPSDALARMLAGTGLWATEDPKNGAFVVHREIPDPNAPRTAPPQPGDRPKNQRQAISPATRNHL